MLRITSAVGVVGVSLVLLFAEVGLQGQEGDKKEAGKAKGQLPMNWKSLGLSDQQKQAVYKLQTDYKEKITAIQGQIKKLQTEEKAELLKVLTPEQREQLRKLYADKAGATAVPPEKVESKKGDSKQ